MPLSLVRRMAALKIINALAQCRHFPPKLVEVFVEARIDTSVTRASQAEVSPRPTTQLTPLATGPLAHVGDGIEGRWKCRYRLLHRRRSRTYRCALRQDSASAESIAVMSVKVGGIYVDRAETRVANEVCAELRRVSGEIDSTDYVVDLCFMTYLEGGMRSEDVAGTGIRPGTVGRRQRRFMVWIEVPPLLEDRKAYARWIAEALFEAAKIVSDYLPRKAKAYPAERLAEEVNALRNRWLATKRTSVDFSNVPRRLLDVTRESRRRAAIARLTTRVPLSVSLTARAERCYELVRARQLGESIGRRSGRRLLHDRGSRAKLLPGSAPGRVC